MWFRFLSSALNVRVSLIIGARAPGLNEKRTQQYCGKGLQGRNTHLLMFWEMWFLWRSGVKAEQQLQAVTLEGQSIRGNGNQLL